MAAAVENVKKVASPAEVRAWARGEGYEVGTRGRLNPDVIKAYNACHGVKYREAQHVPAVEVAVKPEKGRKIVRRVNIAQVRKAALDAGVEVGTRGRLPREVVEAYVLGTLG